MLELDLHISPWLISQPVKVLSGLNALCSDQYSSSDDTFKETHFLEFRNKQRHKLFGVCSKPSRRNGIPKSEETSLGVDQTCRSDETFDENHFLEFRSKQGFKLFSMFSKPSGNDIQKSEETRGDNDPASISPELVPRRLSEMRQGHLPPMFPHGINIRCGATPSPKVTTDSRPSKSKSENLSYDNSQRLEQLQVSSSVGSRMEKLRMASSGKPNFSASSDSSNFKPAAGKFVGIPFC
jgi:hypothetical protein